MIHRSYYRVQREIATEKRNSTERMGENIHCISSNFCLRSLKTKFNQAEILLVTARLTLKLILVFLFGHLPSTDFKRNPPNQYLSQLQKRWPCSHKLTRPNISAGKTSSPLHTHRFYIQQVLSFRLKRFMLISTHWYRITVTEPNTYTSNADTKCKQIKTPVKATKKVRL